MPAKNIHHDAVVEALKADGWNITDDPLRLTYGGRDMFVDLGAVRATLGAEKAGRKIAVEIQSFLHPSPVRALQEAVGQYVVYRVVMAEREPERALYMAVHRAVREEGALSDKFGQLIIDRLQVKLVLFDPVIRRLVEWIG